jgi:hypothetical protein
VLFDAFLSYIYMLHMYVAPLSPIGAAGKSLSPRFGSRRAVSTSALFTPFWVASCCEHDHIIYYLLALQVQRPGTQESFTDCRRLHLLP